MMSLIEHSKKPGITSSSEAVKTFVLLLIRFYQLCIGPLLGSNCRFYPTCSRYATEAFHTHAPGAATLLTMKRLCKCHPWGDHGYDPVPGKGHTT